VNFGFEVCCINCKKYVLKSVGIVQRFLLEYCECIFEQFNSLVFINNCYIFFMDGSYETYEKHVFVLHLFFTTVGCSGDIALPVKFHLHSQYNVFLFLFVRFHTVREMVTVTVRPVQLPHLLP